MKVVTAEQMQKIDATAAARGLTTDILMENAGRAIAEETKNLLNRVIGKSILLLIGPGNNGGDGLVAARYLDEWGAEVSLYLVNPRKADDKNFIATQERKIPALCSEQDSKCKELSRTLESVEVVIDAIFGTGTSRLIDGIYKTILDSVIEAKTKRPELYLIAVDMPSGLNANTGAVDASCPQINATITLGLPKPGLFNFPGAEKAGKVIIADIGIPTELTANIQTELIESDWVGDTLPTRPGNSNKGTFGKVMVVSGSINYIGAAYLACMAAYRSGSGLVTLACAKTLLPILASKMAETTYLPLNEIESGVISTDSVPAVTENLRDCDVLLIGCGLGLHPETKKAITSILFDKKGLKNKPLVIDADALNALSEQPEWWQRLGEHVILTPHPGEMARLVAIKVEDIQKDRLSIALKKAREWKKVIVLKGAYTIIASPDGRAKISTIVNPGLASAGTGDVLAGIIAGLVAQGMPLFEAASCGVFLHGEAAMAITKEKGNAGMLASDLLPVLPGLIKRLKEKNNDNT